ncbi:alpha-ketoglutarate-dependent dioxygenase AlkB [Bartonella sp. LJL80]
MKLHGFDYFPDYFDRTAQEALLHEVRQVAAKAPLFVPIMPNTGKAMSVRQTNCGKLGWVTDKERGYRYQAHHPVTKQVWPDIPEQLLDLWETLSGFSAPPEACLINFYAPDARMGMHQDKDENALEAPVISISLGDSCLFRMGSTTRGGKTHSIRLNSGDVIMFGGATRLAYHGVDRIYPDTSTLLKTPGRINLTLRRVTPQ